MSSALTLPNSSMTGRKERAIPINFENASSYGIMKRTEIVIELHRRISRIASSYYIRTNAEIRPRNHLPRVVRDLVLIGELFGRIGQPKALLEHQSKPLYAHAVRLLLIVCLSARQGQSFHIPVIYDDCVRYLHYPPNKLIRIRDSFRHAISRRLGRNPSVVPSL